MTTPDQIPKTPQAVTSLAELANIVDGLRQQVSALDDENKSLRQQLMQLTCAVDDRADDFEFEKSFTIYREIIYYTLVLVFKVAKPDVIFDDNRSIGAYTQRDWKCEC